MDEVKLHVSLKRSFLHPFPQTETNLWFCSNCQLFKYLRNMMRCQNNSKETSREIVYGIATKSDVKVYKPAIVRFNIRSGNEFIVVRSIPFKSPIVPILLKIDHRFILYYSLKYIIRSLRVRRQSNIWLIRKFLKFFVSMAIVAADQWLCQRCFKIIPLFNRIIKNWVSRRKNPHTWRINAQDSVGIICAVCEEKIIMGKVQQKIVFSHRRY